MWPILLATTAWSADPCADRPAIHLRTDRYRAWATACPLPELPAVDGERRCVVDLIHVDGAARPLIRECPATLEQAASAGLRGWALAFRGNPGPGEAVLRVTLIAPAPDDPVRGGVVYAPADDAFELQADGPYVRIPAAREPVDMRIGRLDADLEECTVTIAVDWFGRREAVRIEECPESVHDAARREARRAPLMIRTVEGVPVPYEAQWTARIVASEPIGGPDIGLRGDFDDEMPP